MGQWGWWEEEGQSNIDVIVLCLTCWLKENAYMLTYIFVIQICVKVYCKHWCVLISKDALSILWNAAGVVSACSPICAQANLLPPKSKMAICSHQTDSLLPCVWFDVLQIVGGVRCPSWHWISLLTPGLVQMQTHVMAPCVPLYWTCYGAAGKLCYSVEHGDMIQLHTLTQISPHWIRHR